MRVKEQTKTYGPKTFTEDGEECRITAKVRHDDNCGNGRNSFSITADIRMNQRGRWVDWVDWMGGCCHVEVAKHFPELAPFIKWHLCFTDAPMHYIANARFHAGFGEYSERNIAHLYSTIVFGAVPKWDAGRKPEEMTEADLVLWLKERLPDLMVAFQKDVESLGFNF